MSEEKNWQLALQEYIRQGEPNQIEKSEAWQTAIGLQAVDGLQISAYLLDTAKEHIEGKIDIDEAQKRIQSYYEEYNDRIEAENETKEADIVSSRIAKLLSEKTFQFSPAEWLSIHRRLFEINIKSVGIAKKYYRKSLRTIKREMAEMKEKGYICRLNGKRNGKWEVLIDI